VALALEYGKIGPDNSDTWCSYKEPYEAIRLFGSYPIQFQLPDGESFPLTLQLYRLFPVDSSLMMTALPPLILGYFPYRISDYPWPPGIDVPPEDIVALVPLIHSLFLQENDYSLLGTPLQLLVRKHLKSFSGEDPTVDELVSFVRDFGVYMFRLLPYIYAIKEE